MSRTYRKPYRESRRFDKTCRCHGGCPWCKGNRLYNDRKWRLAADQEIKEYMDGHNQTELPMGNTAASEHA